MGAGLALAAFSAAMAPRGGSVLMQATAGRTSAAVRSEQREQSEDEQPRSHHPCSLKRAQSLVRARARPGEKKKRRPVISMGAPILLLLQ